jgi:hypothetical protein
MDIFSPAFTVAEEVREGLAQPEKMRTMPR